MDKLIITPTYNEIENLEIFVEGVFEHLPETDILVIDDASPDGTGDLADRLARAEERIHVVHREGKQGLGTAYRAGFAWALERDYQYVFEMDTDLSHDPVYLPLFMRANAGRSRNCPKPRKARTTQCRSWRSSRRRPSCARRWSG